MQEGHLIALESIKLNDVERRYSTHINGDDGRSTLPKNMASLCIGCLFCCHDRQHYDNIHPVLEETDF